MTTKLNIKERIRLEALNQANGSMIGATTKEILTRAEVFEHYIKTGEINSAKPTGTN